MNFQSGVYMDLLEYFPILDLSQSLTASVLAVTFFLLFVGLVASYFMITLPMYLLFNVREGKGAVKLQEKIVPEGQVKSEITWSIASMLQYAMITTILLAGWHEGYFDNLYIDPTERGWTYFLASIVILVLIQDALFYWTHRLLHTKRFAKYHVRHHRSKTPTVFAVYSFHPFEAFLHAIRLPIILLILPVNLFAIIISENLISNFVNAYGHLNYEPKFVRKIRAFHRNFAGNATYHNVHHAKGCGNYGFYLKFWDRVFGTEIESTEELFDKVHGCKVKT